MKKMKVLISFFFALLFTQSCSSAGLAAADKLRISYSAVNATQAFLWVAQEKNFFAKHGLEGELLYINSGTMNFAGVRAVALAHLAPEGIAQIAQSRDPIRPQQHSRECHRAGRYVHRTGHETMDT